MKARGSLLAGAGMGAGLAYFLDPVRGARRRARVRDSVVHTATLTRRAIGTTGRDVLHRTYGAAASLRTLSRRGPVDDAVLVDRVRASLDRGAAAARHCRERYVRKVTTRDLTWAAVAVTAGITMLWLAAGRRRAPPREHVSPLGWNAGAELTQATSRVSPHEPDAWR